MQLVVVSDVMISVRMVTTMSNTRFRVFLVESFIVVSSFKFQVSDF